MSSGKNGRNTIWVYAVILFTSAFIVLLLTAYSQIKFNKNLNDYKNQLYTEENDKNNFKNNLGTALSENKRISDELKTVKQQLEDAKAKVEEGNAILKKQQHKTNDIVDAYEYVVQAYIEYNKGNLLKSADILYSSTDTKILGKEGMELYEELVPKVYGKAAEILYQEGYKSYINKQYEEAVKSFRKSLNYASSEYFSDDCLYFIGYSRYRQQNYKEAKDTMEKLINEYPESNYKKSASDLIKEMGF